jgi:hypothetical protein
VAFELLVGAQLIVPGKEKKGTEYHKTKRMNSYKIWSGLQRRTANPANGSVIPIPMEALIAAVRHGVIAAVRHGVLVAE